MMVRSTYRAAESEGRKSGSPKGMTQVKLTSKSTLVDIDMTLLLVELKAGPRSAAKDTEED